MKLQSPSLMICNGIHMLQVHALARRRSTGTSSSHSRLLPCLKQLELLLLLLLLWLLLNGTAHVNIAADHAG